MHIMCATFKLHTTSTARPPALRAPRAIAPWLHAGGALPRRRGRRGSNRAVLHTNYTILTMAMRPWGYTYDGYAYYGYTVY